MKLAALAVAVLLSAIARAEEARWFGIRVVDEATGRGVPMVELRTVNDIALHTDSAGWAAFLEPGLMDREVFFAVSSPGYEFPADGFGSRGVRLQTRPGATTEIKLRRGNVAERVARLTGQGIFRDSTLLGRRPPDAAPDLRAGVLGQDSVQAVPYRGRIFWLWGDTQLPHYPLGIFRSTAATSPLPADPAAGVAFEYFADPQHPERARAMVPGDEPGAVWLFGLLNVPDDTGRETLLAHFSRHKDLATVVEHGLVRFDEARGVFEKIAPLEPGETWRFPRGNAVRVEEAGEAFFYFAAPFANTRVRATWAAVRDPQRYEALAWEGKSYAWQREHAPTTQQEEARLVRAGELPLGEARYQLLAPDGTGVSVHGASITWNEFRRRWILIGLQQGERGAPSYLGEVWYAEGDTVSGPWRRAVKIASHPGYSFYNPRQHAFLATDGGRRIFFEGTFTRTFANQPVAVPRYEYNQLLYRLDLEDPRLQPAR